MSPISISMNRILLLLLLFIFLCKAHYYTRISRSLEKSLEISFSASNVRITTHKHTSSNDSFVFNCTTTRQNPHLILSVFSEKSLLFNVTRKRLAPIVVHTRSLQFIRSVNVSSKGISVLFHGSVPKGKVICVSKREASLSHYGMFEFPRK